MVLRQMQLLICMVGLLGEHCDFDQVRLDRQGRMPAHQKDLPKHVCRSRPRGGPDH